MATFVNDADNYRAIAISNSISKLLEACILDNIKSFADVDKYQLGFKPKHSTSLCTSILKRTVDYYTSRCSHVFTCFVDLSKAFDKLLDDNIVASLISLLVFWTTNQTDFVRWHDIRTVSVRSYCEFGSVCHWL